MRDFMKSMEILHTFSFSVRKSAYVERFNQTFEDLMAKEKDNSTRWIDKVEKVMYRYNYVNKHSFIKMTPFEGEQPENQVKISNRFKNKHSKIKYKLPKFKPGDKVRIWRDKGKFKRSYHADYTDEVFEITEVLSNLLHPRYKLKDLQGQSIMGNFLQEELSKFIPS